MIKKCIYCGVWHVVGAKSTEDNYICPYCAHKIRQKKTRWRGNTSRSSKEEKDYPTTIV